MMTFKQNNKDNMYIIGSHQIKAFITIIIIVINEAIRFF